VGDCSFYRDGDGMSELKGRLVPEAKRLDNIPPPEDHDCLKSQGDLANMVDRLRGEVALLNSQKIKALKFASEESLRAGRAEAIVEKLADTLHKEITFDKLKPWMDEVCAEMGMDDFTFSNTLIKVRKVIRGALVQDEEDDNGECPECQNIEDDQYTCTTCWKTGGLHARVNSRRD